MAIVNWTADWIESDDFVGGVASTVLSCNDRSPTSTSTTLPRSRRDWRHAVITNELPSTPAGAATARHLFLLIEGSMAAAM